MATLSRKMISLDSIKTKDGKGLVQLLCEGNYSKLKSKLAPIKGIPHPKTALGQMSKKDYAAVLTTLVNAGCDLNAEYLTKTPLETFISLYEYELTKERRSFFFGKSELKDFDWNLLASFLYNGARVTDYVGRGVVHIALSLLAQNNKKNDVSDSNLTAPYLEKYTPLGVFNRSNDETRTKIGKEIINYLSARDPKLLTGFLGGYLELVKTRVNCGEILLTFLLQQFKRWEKDPAAYSTTCMPASVSSAMTKIASTLITTGMDTCTTAVDSYTNMTPLHLAAILGMDTVVAMLVQHPTTEVNSEDHMGNTPLACALRTVCKNKTWQQTNFSNYLSIISSLMEHSGINLSKKDSTGFTPFVWCILLMTSISQQYREIGSYKLLQEAKPSLRVLPSAERTPLMMCVVGDLPSLLQLLLSDRARGVELKRSDSCGMTALHLAGRHARWECVEALLDQEPSLANIQDKLGNTALFYIVETLGADRTIYLINKYKNWDLSIRNIYSQNIFYYYKDCVKVKKMEENKNLELLLMKGVQDSVGGRDWRFPSTLTVANKTGSLRDVSYKPQDSWGKKMAQALSESGATHSRKRRSMRMASNPLNSLDTENCISLTQHIKNLENIKLLFQAFALKTNIGQDVDFQISGGHTVAMMCAMEGFADDLKFLIQNCNPNLDLWDNNDKTALHHASINGHASCVNILLDATDNINAIDSDGNSTLFYIVERFPYSYAANKLHRYSWNFQIVNYLGQNVHSYYVENCEETAKNEKLDKLLEMACMGGPVRNSNAFTVQADVLADIGLQQRENHRHSYAFSTDTLDDSDTLPIMDRCASTMLVPVKTSTTDIKSPPEVVRRVKKRVGDVIRVPDVVDEQYKQHYSPIHSNSNEITPM